MASPFFSINALKDGLSAYKSNAPSISRGYEKQSGSGENYSLDWTPYEDGSFKYSIAGDPNNTSYKLWDYGGTGLPGQGDQLPGRYAISGNFDAGPNGLRGRDWYDENFNYLKSDTWKREGSGVTGLKIASILALPFAAAGLQGAFGAGAGAAEGAASFLPAHEMTHAAGFLSELGPGGFAGQLAGAGAGLTGGSGSSVLDKILTGGKSLLNGGKMLGGITSLLGGGGGGGSGGGGGGGSLLDLLGLGAAGLAGYKQYDAGKDMLEWLNGQQAKIDNLYKPGSDEYNQLFDQLSRKDAAAGRNSQYGPRSVDLAARIAEIKARNTANLTTGIGNTYAAALNNKANAFAGLPALLNYGKQRGLGSTLDNLFGNSGGGGNVSSGLGSFFDSIDSGQVQLPPEYFQQSPMLDDEGLLDLFNFYS